MTAAHESDLKRHLTDEQIHVTQGKGTERAFTGKYVDLEDDGTCACVCCGTGLFSSDHKYDSGSGWPSFWLPLAAKESAMQRIPAMAWLATRSFARTVVLTSVTYLKTVHKRPIFAILLISHRSISKLLER